MGCCCCSRDDWVINRGRAEYLNGNEAAVLSVFGPDPIVVVVVVVVAAVAVVDSAEGEVVRGAYEGPALRDLCARTLVLVVDGVGHSGGGNGVLLLSSCVPLSVGVVPCEVSKGVEKKKTSEGEDRADEDVED